MPCPVVAGSHAARLRRLFFAPLLVSVAIAQGFSCRPGESTSPSVAAQASDSAETNPAPGDDTAGLPPAVAHALTPAGAPQDDPPTGHHGPNTLSDAELDAGWILLFDGESLFGWERESDTDWVVLQGAITATGGERGLLRTTSQFSDFILRFDVRYAPEANSGVFLRAPADLQRGEVGTACYEANIAPAFNPFPTGSLVERQKVAGDWHHGDLSMDDFQQAKLDEGQWQSWEIRAWEDEVSVSIDDEIVLGYTDLAEQGRGYIALQFNEGPVAFRNIKLKPLGLTLLFNGTDLAGWRELPDMPSQFTVTPEGFVHVENGPGQLETETTWGDFVLQAECLVDGEDLNSGIFFRSIPGERMNGYESQIQNGYIDGDRNRPVDTGTGGIYRRVTARRVVSDDFVWFYKTIVADGPHFAVWVNGWQVTDWTDERAPAENPREGLRLAPGTIILQAHDPTTNLFFRNFRAVELRPRELQ